MDDMEIPECFRRIHELLDGTAMHHNSPSLDEAIKEPDHTTKQQTPSVYEMDEVQIEILRLQSHIDSLNAYNRNLARDNAKMASVVSENRELRDKLASEQNITEQLTKKLSLSSSALEQVLSLSQRLRFRNQNNERELEELRAKLDAAEKDRDWHRKQHTEILEDCNMIKAARASDNQRLEQVKSRLRQRNLALSLELHRHLRDVADFVTHLDLAAEEVRVYTCYHNNLKEITPKSDKSTRIKPMGMIANEMYKNWADDERFKEEYQQARKAICNHHGAHEKAGHVNGDYVSHLKAVLGDLDWRRGISQPSS
ncbi:uncharacterized protein yc1106_05588 [Curvularia clavata]|uniref:Uncharacterized protein n=1 Tax=Curvularia clavata TaxID=95742 RepID=A0A9Q8Z948_CURCL|nr:uncharacterized protein yc1106_05588 [Curvularia clavata]